MKIIDITVGPGGVTLEHRPSKTKVTWSHQVAAMWALWLRSAGLIGECFDLRRLGLGVTLSPPECLALAGDLFGASCTAALDEGLRFTLPNEDGGEVAPDVGLVCGNPRYRVAE